MLLSMFFAAFAVFVALALLLKGHAAFYGLFGADMQVEDDIGLYGKTIELTYPGCIQATSGITCEGGVGVAIGDDNFSAFQGRFDHTLCAIHVVCTVEEAVG